MISEQVVPRFLRYVSYDTQSSETTGTHPSMPGETVLANAIAEELRRIGLTSVRVSSESYVYAELPAESGFESAPILGLIAHLDTSNAASGKDIHPVIVTYNGNPIPLGHSGKTLVPDSNCAEGAHLIITDGTTLLGADDKAGIAEIITAVERMMSEHRPHGAIHLCFTPDEEIGEGTLCFDLKGFGADYAYTLDGGKVGGIEFENFHAAKAELNFSGRSFHPGDSKNRMVNAQKIAMEFDSMLPSFETPEHTSGYEGFYHLIEMQGNVSSAKLYYILREFDAEKFQKEKDTVVMIADYLNRKYGQDTVKAVITDQYRNMAEVIRKYPFLIDLAEKAVKKAGVKPFFSPIRGGTDGATLSWSGLPCPNLGTGGYNYHGEMEYAVVEEMEQSVEIILNLAELFSTVGK